MMHQGVLVGKTGPVNSVIKLRPPMTFKKEHADLLVDKINQCLRMVS
jgi:4-aminobutyrate aminotransferase-like enzyme